MPQDENGKWYFPITFVDHVPPRIGRGQDGDPIYGVLSVEGMAACRTYYREAAAFLENRVPNAPSLEILTSVCTSHGAIRDIGEVLSSTGDVAGPKAPVYIFDEDRSVERIKRKARFFDPEYVPALVMLSAPGGSYRFNDSKSRVNKTGLPTPADDRRLFLSFGRRSEQNVRVLRVIANPPRGAQVHRINSRLDKHFHYDHRRNSLTFKHDETMRREKYAAGFSGKGRQEAIKAAGEHYKRAQKKHGKTAVLHLGPSRASFEKDLRSYFDIADRLHAELTRRRRATGDD